MNKLKKSLISGLVTTGIVVGAVVAGAAPAQAVSWSGCTFHPTSVGTYAVGTNNQSCSRTQAVIQRINQNTNRVSTYRSAWVGPVGGHAIVQSTQNSLWKRANAVITDSNLYFF